MIYLAADHRGFPLKEIVEVFLADEGYEYEDVGADHLDPEDDYVDFALDAAKKIAENPETHRGIFICGSGHGMDIVANRFHGIRAALCFNADVARQSREHEDSNVLVLPADWLTPDQEYEIFTTWLETKFSGEERHVRRMKKIKEIEERNFR